MRLPAIVVFAAMALITAGSASGAIEELIVNGGFEAGGAGWDASNVLFGNSYQMAGNGQVDPVAPYLGSMMAILSGLDISSDASLTQDVSVSGMLVGNATVSFAYRLEADDITAGLLLDSDNEADFLVASMGGVELLNIDLDDWLSWFIVEIGPGSTRTDWIPFTAEIPVSSLASPLTISFDTENLDLPDQDQNFVAYVDAVSISAHVVPAPASMIVWGLLGAICVVGIVVRRRIRSATAINSPTPAS